MVLRNSTLTGLFQRVCDGELLWAVDSYESLDHFLDLFSGLLLLFCPRYVIDRTVMMEY
jgi:hypothetical protein